MSDFLEYDPGTHSYFHNGVELPSVTTILQRAGLTQQYGLTDEHRWRGIRVHQLCHEDDQKRLDMRKVDPYTRGYVRAWRDFRSVSGFDVVDSEKRVWSPEAGYAGTLDRVGTRNGSPWPVLCDIKSMRVGTPTDVVRYQTVAYAHAYKPGQIFERMAVAVREDGTFGVRTWSVETFFSDLAYFLQLVEKVKNMSLDA